MKRHIEKNSQVFINSRLKLSLEYLNICILYEIKKCLVAEFNLKLNSACTVLRSTKIYNIFRQIFRIRNNKCFL